MKAIGTITLAVIATVLVSCGDENSRMRGDFIRGCTQTGGQKSQCSCVFDTFTENHDPRELLKLNSPSTKPTDPVVTDFQAAALSCRNG